MLSPQRPRTRSSLLAAALLMPSAATLFLTPSAASAAITDCPTSNLCIWAGTTFTSYRAGTATQWPDLSAFPRPGCPQSTWNDCALSVANRFSPGHYYTGYTEAQFIGSMFTLNGGDNISSIASRTLSSVAA